MGKIVVIANYYQSFCKIYTSNGIVADTIESFDLLIRNGVQYIIIIINILDIGSSLHDND